MKKIKKVLSLALASLVTGGLIFSTSINTTTANAEIYRGYKYREMYYHAEQKKINGKYNQRISFKFRSKNLPFTFKGYYSLICYVGNDGYLKLRKYNTIKSTRYIFDDAYMMIVTDDCWNVRFKWLSNYKPKSTDQEEMEYIIEEFNKARVGLGNRIMLIPRHWKETIVFDKDGPYSALKKIGYNDWGIGYTDDAHKYSTSLQVTNEGLQEVQGYWGNYRMFESP